jgi:hypothetical protein
MKGLEAQLTEARKDTERLEWLEANCWQCVTSVDGFYDEEIDMDRQAIDNAMKGQNDE